MAELQELVAGSSWHDAGVRAEEPQWRLLFTATGFVNGCGREVTGFDLFPVIIARRPLGSYGLVNDRDDETPDPAGPGSCRILRSPELSGQGSNRILTGKGTGSSAKRQKVYS